MLSNSGYLSRRVFGFAMLVLGVLVLVLLIGSRDEVEAQSDGVVEVDSDWALVPSGLGAGAEFRLLFLTTAAYQATQTGIDSYNSRVQTQAASGHAAIQEHSSLFKAVGSTSAVDARDNIGMNPNNAAHPDVPVYWLGGPRVAANTAGFWSSSWENWSGTDCRNPSGTACANANSFPWTGSNADGTKHANPLGNSPNVRHGSLAVNGNTQNPISKNNRARTEQRAMFGISPVFRVVEVVDPNALVEGGDPGEFTWTFTEQISQSREIEVFAGSGLEIRLSTGPPAFVQRYRFWVVPAARNVPFTFEVRAVDDGWDVPGIWRQPGNTGNTYTSQFRVYEIDQGHRPVVESVVVPVTIVDNDPPMLSLSGGGPVAEGAPAVFTVVATSPPAGDLTVRYRVRQNDPFVVFPGDFVAEADLGFKTVVLQAGALSADFEVATEADELDEADGSVRVTLLSGSEYTLAAPRYQEVAVIDDDPAVLSLVDPGFVFEGRTARFKVRSTSPAKDGLTVSYEASETGNFFADSVLGEHSVRFPDGSRTATISIPTVDDSFWDPRAALTVALRVGTGYVLGEPSEATIAVLDLYRDYGFEDDPWKMSGSEPDDGEYESHTPSLGEGDGPKVCGSADVLAAEARANHDALPITLANKKERNDWWRAWIALSGKTGTYNTPLTAAEAQVLESGDARWTPFRKALECAEGTPPTTTPEVSVTAGSGITEGGDASFTVTANPAPTAPLSVSVTVAQDGDFGASTGSQTVTVPIGGSATVTVSTSDDSTDEDDGSVSVTVDAGSGYTVSSAQGSAKVTVADNDDPPPVIPEVSVTAGGGITEGANASFAVTASPAPASPLSVNVTVSQNGNYGASTGSQTVTVGTGGTATVTVATSDDSTDETDGSVTVTVNSHTGYTVSSSQGSATVNVADNDVPPSTDLPEVSIADASSVEGPRGGYYLRFVVTLSERSDRNVIVHYQVRQGTARLLQDYIARSWRIVLKPGQTSGTIWVQVRDDRIPEEDETLQVVLARANGATITDGTATGTIIDND